MLALAKWIGPPMIAGALMGATLQRGPAHACDCGEAYWAVERERVESTDSAINDEQLWPAEGQLYPRRLSLWQENHSLNVDYAR